MEINGSHLGLWGCGPASPSLPISHFTSCPDWRHKWAPASYKASRNIDIHQRAALKTQRGGGRRLFLMRHVSSSDCFGLLLFPYRLSAPGAAAAAAAQAAAVSSDPPESSQACVNVNAAAVYSPCGREEVDTPLTDVPHSIAHSSSSSSSSSSASSYTDLPSFNSHLQNSPLDSYITPLNIELI